MVWEIQQKSVSYSSSRVCMGCSDNRDVRSLSLIRDLRISANGLNRIGVPVKDINVSFVFSCSFFSTSELKS